MAPLQTVAETLAHSNQSVSSDLRPRHQRQKRSTKIPVQNPTHLTATPSTTLGTLIVSLPSGRLLDVKDGCVDGFQLCKSIHPGTNLLQQLDGKGAQLLTLQAFGGTSKARMFARLKIGPLSRPCSFACEFAVDPLNVANKIATIRVFGIQFATKPERECDEFITRSNSGCNLIYFDAASVPYLGHFPSEKSGSSLFSIIHAEDAPQIQEVHQELRAGVKLARTNGIRFVAHDGRVWRVNSEWAAFTNPWSQHVEMIVAKHRLVEIVGQVSSANELLNDEQCRQYDNAVRMILETPPEFTHEKKEKLVDENLIISQGAISPPYTKNSSEDSPPSQSPDLLLSYNQINCLENVHRLLKSQTNESNQKNNDVSNTTNINQAAPLTRELLYQHDVNWENNYKGKWQQRLKMKRAVSSSNASTAAHEIIPSKVAKTEPTSPSATNATSLFLSLLIEQQRRLQQQQQTSNGQLPMLATTALSNLLAQNATSGTSTPSNL